MIETDQLLRRIGLTGGMLAGRSQAIDSLGHLCRQVGSVQPHIGVGGSVTVW